MFSSLAAALLVLGSGQAAPAFGPLTLRSHAMLFDNRVSYTPGPVPTLPPYRGALTASLTHVNLWAQMPGYFFDGEWTRLSLRGAWGLPHGLTLQAELPVVGRSGGFLDPFIMGFHRLFGITQARRDRYPQNRLRVATFADGTDREQLGDRAAGAGIANPTLGAKKRLLGSDACSDTGTSVVAELTVQLPLGDVRHQFATRQGAGLVALAVEQPLPAGFALSGAFGVVVAPGSVQVLGMPLTSVQKFFFAAARWQAAAAWSLVAQYLNQDGIVARATFSPLDQTTHEFALGAQWAASDAWLVEAAVIENSVHDANTPDFGLHLGLRCGL